MPSETQPRVSRRCCQITKQVRRKCFKTGSCADDCGHGGFCKHGGSVALAWRNSVCQCCIDPPEPPVQRTKVARTLVRPHRRGSSPWIRYRVKKTARMNSSTIESGRGDTKEANDISISRNGHLKPLFWWVILAQSSSGEEGSC